MGFQIAPGGTPYLPVMTYESRQQVGGMMEQAYPPSSGTPGRVVVDEQGVPGNVTVDSGTDHVHGRALAAVIRKLRFHPARVGNSGARFCRLD